MNAGQQRLQQQQRALRAITIFNWVGIAFSVPLAFVLATIFQHEGVTPVPGLGFGLIALMGAIGWAVMFYRRASARDLTINERLKRLGQAAITAAYPAYLGVAVAVVTGMPSGAAAFIGIAAVNVTAVKRLGQRMLAEYDVSNQGSITR